MNPTDPTAGRPSQPGETQPPGVRPAEIRPTKTSAPKASATKISAPKASATKTPAPKVRATGDQPPTAPASRVASDNSDPTPLLSALLELACRVNALSEPAKAGYELAAGLYQTLTTDRVLVLRSQPNCRLIAADSGYGPFADSALQQDLKRLAKRTRGQLGATVLSAQQLSELDSFSPEFGKQWLWVIVTRGKRCYTICLQRDQRQPWQQAECRLLAKYLPIVVAALEPAQQTGFGKKRWWLLGLLLVLFIPVPDYSVAPARVIAHRQHSLYLPVDGVLQSIVVRSGQWVEPGTLIAQLDTRDIDRQIEEAGNSLAVANAELGRLQAAGWHDPTEKSRIPVQEWQVKQAQANYDYLLQTREKMTLRANASGTLLIDAPQRLVGSWLRTGDELLRIADERTLALEIDLDVADIGRVSVGAPLSFRPDGQALQKYDATIDERDRHIKISAAQKPALRLRAKLAEQGSLVLAEQGTTRIDTGWAPLAEVLLRKPWRVLRGIFQ